MGDADALDQPLTHPRQERRRLTGSMLNDRVVRLNTKSGDATEYLLPRTTNIRRVFVDNTTTPVTFWSVAITALDRQARAAGSRPYVFRRDSPRSIKADNSPPARTRSCWLCPLPAWSITRLPRVHTPALFDPIRTTTEAHHMRRQLQAFLRTNPAPRRSSTADRSRDFGRHHHRGERPRVEGTSPASRPLNKLQVGSSSRDPTILTHATPSGLA
jgi:hypothetical protein